METKKSIIITLMQLLMAITAVLTSIAGLLTIFRFITGSDNSTIWQANLFIASLFTAALSIIALYGIIKESKIGWRFLNAYFIVSLSKAVIAFITILVNYSPDLYTSSREHLTVKFAGRIAFNILLIILTFKKDILSFFKIEPEYKRPEFIKAFSISVAVIAIPNILNLVFKVIL